MAAAVAVNADFIRTAHVLLIVAADNSGAAHVHHRVLVVVAGAVVIGRTTFFLVGSADCFLALACGGTFYLYAGAAAATVFVAYTGFYMTGKVSHYYSSFGILDFPQNAGNNSISNKDKKIL